MKKIVGLFLSLGLIVMMTGCKGESNQDTLVVGSETFGGYFLPSEGLSNGMADATIRDLLHSGESVSSDENGEMLINPSVIKSNTRVEDEDGNVTYTFTIQDMKWSDGEVITSDDYLFALLLAASPAYSAAGALDATGEGLLGYWDYYDGVAEVFSGIAKEDDKTFSLTIDAAELPYFWELAYVSVAPYPMHALVQDGETIVSDANGSYFDGDMEQAVETFITTYNETQKPSCGAYTLDSYENGQVSMSLNENYMGDINGKKPSISHVVVKEVFEDTAMDALLAGEIDILEPVLEDDRIDAGVAAEAEGKIQFVSFPRNGYGVFATKDDMGATKEVEVRRAIAYLLDRSQLAKEVMGSYGSVLDSDYALDQWMYQEAGDLNLLYAYAFSIKQANEQLDASSYRFEQDGVTPWDVNQAGSDYYRYNATGEVLELRHLATDDNEVSDVVENQLMKNAPLAGMKYTMDRTDEAGLQEAYYFSDEEQKATTYNAFTLGSEFATIPDPYYASIACDYAKTSANPSNYCDEQMESLMDTLRHTDQNDKATFVEAWKAYLSYFNETLPQIPLYTSTYYGFANADLEGYTPTAYYNWANQIANLHWK